MTAPIPDIDAPEVERWAGRYLVARTRGRWEYVGRRGGVSAAVILALDPDGRAILVEQHRMALGRMCLELPAGLVGDEDSGESIEIAAARELEEETGWRPGRVERIGEFASSPGMLSETFWLVRAHDLVRVGAGGGDAHEAITVHHVALPDLPAFIAARRDAGVAMDAKLLVLLGTGMVGSPA